MKVIIILPALFVCHVAWCDIAWARDAKKGLEIARKVDTANQGFRGESSVMEMILENAHGDTTTRKMNSIVSEHAADGDKSRIEFQWPADVKGTRMLTLTHKAGDDDQWLYLPAANQVKRITSRNKSGSFMGSEIAYEDLCSPEVEKYEHYFLADETLDGRPVWKLERVPLDKRSGYSRQLVWIDKEFLNTVKIEYFDRKNVHLKTGTFSNWKRYEKWWRSEKFVVLNHQTRKRSTIVWTERKLSVKHDADEFDSDELAD